MGFYRSAFAVSALAMSLALAACSGDEPIMPDRGAASEPPVAARQSDDPVPADILKAMDPTEGLSFKPLFNHTIEDEDTRMRRIEDQVELLRNDLDNVVIPSVLKLVAARKADIAQKEIEADKARAAAAAKATEEKAAADKAAQQAAQVATVADKPPVPLKAPVKIEAAKMETAKAAAVAPVVPKAEPSVAPPAPAPAPTPAPSTAPAPTETPAPAAASQQPAPAVTVTGVKAVRIGDSPDKTRLVLDLGMKGDFKPTLAFDGTQIVVPLGGVAWSASRTTWEADSAMLISAWSVKDGTFYADLLGPTEIKSAQVIPAVDGKGYRLVIDLHAKGIHK